jgi:hypothetical protein
MVSSTHQSRKKIKVTFGVRAKFDRILNGYRKHYQKAEHKDYLFIPYVLTCAAALEATMNEKLVEYAHRRWSSDEPTLAQSLLSMTLRGKLNALVPLLTDHRFQFNHKHFVYKRLNALISIRNILVHPKPFDKELSVSDQVHPLGYPILDGYVEIAEDLTLGAAEKFNPLEYHEALEKLDKWFFMRLPDHISKVAMLVANNHA